MGPSELGSEDLRLFTLQQQQPRTRNGYDADAMDGTDTNQLGAGPGSVPACNYNYMPNMMPEDDILHSTDFSSPTYEMGSMPNDFFLLSNFWPVPTGD